MLKEVLVVRSGSRWWLALLLTALVLGLAACSSSDQPAETSETQAPAETAPASDVAVTEPADTAEPGADPVPEVVEPPEDVVESPEATEPAADVAAETPRPEDAFSRAQSALEDLETYRYETSFLFVGEEDGEPEMGSIELSGIVAGPDRIHLTWRDLGEGEAFEVIQLGNQAWVLEDGEWTEVPIFVSEAMSAAALIYAPSMAWTGLFGELQPDATHVGKEDVNGVRTDHYAATYAQWGRYWPGEISDATGDIWIAEEGYPVKYSFHATGVDEDGDRGSVTWTMELSDVNGPIEIEQPAVPDQEDDQETF